MSLRSPCKGRGRGVMRNNLGGRRAWIDGEFINCSAESGFRGCTLYTLWVCSPLCPDGPVARNVFNLILVSCGDTFWFGECTRTVFMLCWPPSKCGADPPISIMAGHRAPGTSPPGQHELLKPLMWLVCQSCSCWCAFFDGFTKRGRFSCLCNHI